MKMGLIVELELDKIESGVEQLLSEQPDGLMVEGWQAGMRIAECPSVLEIPLPVLLKVSGNCRPDAMIEGMESWPDTLSLLVPGRPDAIAEWVTSIMQIPTQETEDNHPETAADETDLEAEQHEEDASSSSRVWPRIIPWVEARHKEKTFRMNSERNLSGFTFYMPETAGMEGYEIIFPDSEEEALTHAERMKKYDLRRWLGRYVSVLNQMHDPLVMLSSRTAIERGLKGYDIEMAAYCREQAGLPVIASGGVGTVRHILNLERDGMVAGAVLDKDIYDGSFSLHDVRAFVDAEMDKLKRRGSSLSSGVLAGGRLAGDSTGSSYWQKQAETADSHLTEEK